MATINRTFYKESDTCKSFLSYCIFLSFFIGSVSTLLAQDQLTLQAEEETYAYVSPFKHDPDGFKEVIYEAGMEAKLEEKTNLILPDIFFAYGDANILPQSEIVLQDIVRILNENPALGIELSAHTDSRGNARFNERLSKNRARAMVKYLTRNGVSASRLISVGHGEEQPRNHCGDGIVCSEQEHRENRRIEMRTATIIGKLPTRSTYIYKSY